MYAPEPHHPEYFETKFNLNEHRRILKRIRYANTQSKKRTRVRFNAVKELEREDLFDTNELQARNNNYSE